MGKRGPRPKTKTELKASGGYRPWRNGQRGDNAGFPMNHPTPPRKLTAAERKIWDHVCANVPEDLLSPADADSLASLCWWQCYAEQLRAELNGTEPNRDLHKLHKDAQAECRLLWGKFGLTPVDRARMLPTGPPKDDKPENPIAKILQMRQRKPG